MKNLKRIIEYCFYLLIFLLPWQTRLIWHDSYVNGYVWEYGRLSLYGTQILFFGMMLFYFIWLIKEKKIRQFDFSNFFKKLFRAEILTYWLVVLFVIVSGLSVIWSLDAQLAYYNWVVLLLGISFFSIALIFDFSFKKVALVWVGSCIVQGVLSVWQFFAQSVFANKWLGMAEHLPIVKGSIILQTYSERWLRSYGSLPHPNMLGGFLAIGVLFLFYLAIFGKTSFQRKFVLVGILTIVPALFFSFCRSAELTLVISYIFLAFWILRQKNKEWNKIFFQVSLLIFLIVSVLSWNMLDPVLTRIVSNKPLETHSIEERILFQGQSVNLIRDDWLLGQGIGNYTLAIYQKINNTWPGSYYQPVHNIFLLVLSEIGIFGLINFLLIIILLFAQFFYWRKAEDKELRFKQIILFLMFVSTLIISLFDHYFWTLYFGVMIFWLILGLNLRYLKR